MSLIEKLQVEVVRPTTCKVAVPERHMQEYIDEAVMGEDLRDPNREFDTACEFKQTLAKIESIQSEA